MAGVPTLSGDLVTYNLSSAFTGITGNFASSIFPNVISDGIGGADSVDGSFSRIVGTAFSDNVTLHPSALVYEQVGPGSDVVSGGSAQIVTGSGLDGMTPAESMGMMSVEVLDDDTGLTSDT